MVILRPLLFLGLFVLLVSQTTAQQNLSIHECNNNIGNYTFNGAFAANLEIVLSNLTSNTEIDYGFYNLSHGQNPDKVNAFGMCRGDVKPEECRSCLHNATIVIERICPNQKEAYGWHENCMLRYSNNSILGIRKDTPEVTTYRLANATDADDYNQALSDLVLSLTNKAVSGDSRRKYSAENGTGPTFQTLYLLVQCTPDLSPLHCFGCLGDIVSSIPSCCQRKLGASIIRPSCRVRFEAYPFFEYTADATLAPPPPPQLPSPPPSQTKTSTQGGSNTSRTIILIVVPIVAFVVLPTIISICVYLIAKKPRKNFETVVDDIGNEMINSTESLQFNLETIKVATNNFSDANKLGRGGFGAVYKGKLYNGKEIAVKRLSRNSNQGDIEFKNEVLLVAKLQHRHLIRLLGFCLEGAERLLVYEFVPNKSLDYFIFDPTKSAQLSWSRRYKIIEGIAQGLLYLHEYSRLRIIHHDLKASNILLDEDMNPKIADFGMARLLAMDQTQGHTSRIVGTYGYMAPEYTTHGHFSVKSDVFSFGVLILEIVTSLKVTRIQNGDNFEHLLSIVWKKWREGIVSEIVDSALSNGPLNEIMRCIHIGLLCVQENVADRPTMATVVLMLSSHSLSLSIPSKPAFFMSSKSVSEMKSGAYDSRATRLSVSQKVSVQESINEASITELYPR